MSTVATMEYKGADVETAIAGACQALGVSREALDIQVVSTGSAGIFGLGRRPAVIRVNLRSEREASPETSAKAEPEAATRTPKAAPKASQEAAPAPAAAEQSAPPAPPRERASARSAEPAQPLSPEELTAVENTVSRLLELSVGAATVQVAQDENSGKLRVELSGGEREKLVGPQGQTLEALQYLLRKMASKQLGKRVLLELDAAGFRAERRGQLEERARELAAEVKNSGKTRTMPAMGPAERRIVHLALQEDTEVRSRSVGEGVFKKVLIHPPGKGRRRRKR